VAPRLEFLFEHHSLGEAVGPFLARERSDYVFDCGFGYEVRVEADIIYLREGLVMLNGTVSR
jgi:hypothetical protein